jgi:16S rRNA C967 or C1407 C5-methylase (RsmB/RsmF family)/NOL1/NOP2/fmu family ribosome biogenesis protein
MFKYKRLASELPSALLASLQTAAGFDEIKFREAHLSGEQVVSIRFNPAKQGAVTMRELSEGRVPWTSAGYYLKQRPVFTLDPHFHAGSYYVQEASSMFLEKAIRQTCDLHEDLSFLDLCAAPGGKSTLIQSVISPGSLLVSNEVIKTRVAILAENITKWGADNMVVTNNDPKDFKKLPAFFDCMVIDAPCSGSGMFRKDPEAIEHWSENNVELCCQRQQRIVADSLATLKPGGILIYSTCSYSVEEDEDIADWLIDHHDLTSVPLSVQEDYGIVESRSSKHGCYGYRFYPGSVRGEGFFMTVFKKKEGNMVISKPRSPKRKLELPSKSQAEIAGRYLKDPGNFSLMIWQDDILAIRKSLLERVIRLQQELYIRKAGINMGSIGREELIPSHELVVSTIYSGVFGAIMVDESTALDYLRRKDIRLDTTIRGWAVLVYEGTILGLVKILPNRVNNYYPKEWRILNK